MITTYPGAYAQSGRAPLGAVVQPSWTDGVVENASPGRAKRPAAGMHVTVIGGQQLQWTPMGSPHY
jgi:hypothetical protein